MGRRELLVSVPFLFGGRGFQRLVAERGREVQ